MGPMRSETEVMQYILICANIVYCIESVHSFHIAIITICAYHCFMLHVIVCSGYCDEPLAPANGVINSTGNMEGDTVTYICNEGYNLSGDANRTCQSNGSWSGIPPKCDRTFSATI